MRQQSRARRVVPLLLIAGMAVVAPGDPTSASVTPVSGPGTSKPDSYIRDERTLLILGKALFWDMQLSSDSRMACASCHFHAGADHRLHNALSSVKPLARRPNRLLKSTDFPLAHPAMDAGYRVASSGIHPRRFAAVGRDGLPDAAAPLPAAAGRSLPQPDVRQSGLRNAPSVINAAAYFRLFWDGRANDVFNGRTPYGEDDPAAHILIEERGELVLRQVRIEQATLASQSVEPPLNATEMSYEGRAWPFIGRRMLSARPLAKQRVASDDSVLGPYAKRDGRGLSPELSYLTLIRAAFKQEFWNSNQSVNGDGHVLGRSGATDPTGFTQAEYNFPLFFGLAIQAYESTLISDDTPYDRYQGGDTTALTFIQQFGLERFRRRNCATCHVEPELTLATRDAVRGSAGFAGLGADAGFFNTGVEPTGNDIGLGARDPSGNFLSVTARNRPSLAPWMRGMFKTPNLRNVELTGPYFHTGSKATLEQIIDFYTFGGDYPAASLVAWGPEPIERVAMPAFLRALTDDRVRFERAPFDHPELCVSSAPDARTRAVVPTTSAPKVGDYWAVIPEVGARGNRVPLQTFEELLRGVGRDGSRAHNLAARCPIPYP
jgi:cytochrome c peroxidase